MPVVDSSTKVRYFIRRGRLGAIKIGETCNLTKRLRTLQIVFPDRLHVLGICDASESELHERFKHLRIGGEWFRPGADLIDYIAANSRPWDKPRKGKRGGSRPGAGRKRNDDPRPGSRDAASARILLVKVMKDETQPAALRVRCATAILEHYRTLDTRNGQAKDDEKG